MIFSGSSPFVVPLDDPDLVFGTNEIGVRPRNAEAICDQQRINRLNFDIIVDRKYKIFFKHACVVGVVLVEFATLLLHLCRMHKYFSQY